MTEKELIDRAIMHLYRNNIEPVHDIVLPQFENKGIEIIRILHTIHSIGFADRKENHQRTLGSSGPVYYYWISSKAIHFIEQIPKGEFTDRPYSYYLYLQENKENLEIQKLSGDVQLLSDTLFDYNKVKSRTKRSEVVSWLAIILTLIDIIVQLKGCKGG